MLTKKIIHLLFLSIFIFYSELSSKPIIDTWENYLILINLSRAKVEFRDRKNRNIIKTHPLDLYLVQNGKGYMNGENIYYILTHSGGESGGSYEFTYYFIDRGKLNSSSVNIDGRAAPEVKKISDTEYVLSLTSTLFSDFKIQTEDQWDCSVSLPAYTFENTSGFFTETFSIKNKNLFPLTFQKKWLGKNMDSFQNNEEWLREHNNFLLSNDSPESNKTVSLLQYYYFMSRIGKEGKAFRLIEHSAIRLKAYCYREANSKKEVEERVFIFSKFIKQYRNEILWGRGKTSID